MNKIGFFGVVFLILTVANLGFVSAAEVYTTDVFGNEKESFSKGELVAIHGEGFGQTLPAFIDLHEGSNRSRYEITLTDGDGDFSHYYFISESAGENQVYASDGFSNAQSIFVSSDIWLTLNGCGGEAQRISNFESGEPIFVNGRGFSDGNYGWEINGDYASCNSNELISAGDYTVGENGDFCFRIKTVDESECGKYSVQFGQNSQQYLVSQSICQNNSDCGSSSSQIVCNGNQIYNLTTNPSCVINQGQGSCEYTNTSTFVRDCGNTTEEYRCINNYGIFGNVSARIVHIRGCAGEGVCYGATATHILECPFGCSNGHCNERVAIQPILECVLDRRDGTYQAFFGYSNPNNFSVTIPIGNKNNFSPLPMNRGQPTVFHPGRTNYYPSAYFSVVYTNASLSWVLDGGNATATIASYRACDPICGNGVIENGEECDGGINCESNCRLCIDDDDDGICNEDDNCPNSRQNEPVDQDGCDPFQFCSKFTCGFDCFTADWKDNEDEVYPHDCTVVVPAREGFLQQPICVPTVMSNMCSG